MSDDSDTSRSLILCSDRGTMEVHLGPGFPESAYQAAPAILIEFGSRSLERRRVIKSTKRDSNPSI